MKSMALKGGAFLKKQKRDVYRSVIYSKKITLEKGSFSRCQKLKRVLIFSEEIEVKENVFENCHELKEIESSSSINIDNLNIGISISKKNNLIKGRCKK